MYIAIINEKRGYELEKQQGQIYVRAWREEGENVIIL